MEPPEEETVAKQPAGKKKQNKRKGRDRRLPLLILHALRWAGYGEITPDRRTSRRRKEQRDSSGGARDTKNTKRG